MEGTASLYLKCDNKDLDEILYPEDVEFTSIVNSLVSCCKNSLETDYNELIVIKPNGELELTEPVIFQFELECGDFMDAIEFCKKVLLYIEGLDFWCYINTVDGFAYYLRNNNDHFQQVYVDEDGGDENIYPEEEYSDWHKGLPEYLQLGPMGSYDDKELFLEINDSLISEGSIKPYINKIRNYTNINFLTGYNEDAFTYVVEYADLSRKDEILALLNVMIDAGYDLSRVVENDTIIHRLLCNNEVRNDNEIDTLNEISQLLLGRGATINFVSTMERNIEGSEYMSIDECDETMEEGYYTIFNEMADFERPDSLYYPLIDYADLKLLNYALQWDHHYRSHGGKYYIPDSVCAKMVERLIN